MFYNYIAHLHPDNSLSIHHTKIMAVGNNLLTSLGTTVGPTLCCPPCNLSMTPEEIIQSKLLITLFKLRSDT